MLQKPSQSINEPIQFYACYKNLVGFYEIQKSTQFTKTELVFMVVIKTKLIFVAQVDFCKQVIKTK